MLNYRKQKGGEIAPGDRLQLDAESLRGSNRLDIRAGGLVTPLDLLRFYVDRFSRMSRSLTFLSQALFLEEGEGAVMRAMSGLVGGKSDRVSGAQIKQNLEALRTNMEGCDAPVSLEHISEMLRKIELGYEIEGRDIRELQDAIDRELSTVVFFAIPSARVEYIREPTKGWEGVMEKFPDTQDDIEEMNKCFGLSRYAAAVFHSLLVVEHGLIDLGSRIGVNDPKPGWDATFKKVGWLLKNRALVPEGIEFSFIEQVNARLESMKHAWRNKVNHAAGRLVVERGGINDLIAEEIMIASRSFMRQLADG